MADLGLGAGASPLAIGAAVEFRVWSALLEGSGGLLHPFLPLHDRGLDGIVHRLTDDAFIPVQVKGRTVLYQNDSVQLMILAESLVDDDALVVGAWLHQGALGPLVLVATEAEVKRLAHAIQLDGRPGYELAFTFRPVRSPWIPYLFPPEQLAAVLLAHRPGVALEEPRPPLVSKDRDRVLGFLGEVEVQRRLVEVPDLELYRPLPDLEPIDLLTRNHSTRRCLGLQVKTVGWTPSAAHAPKVTFHTQSWRPAGSLVVAVVAWLPDFGRFHEECLLIPSADVLGLSHRDGPEYFSFFFRPGSTAGSRLDPYRRPLAGLGGAVEAFTSPAAGGPP